tara:strand:- start:113 stop:958 length:846 start_codon:yes stop_codon:yes gene_type:complete
MNYYQYNTLPIDYINKKISEFILEDIPDSDITTNATIQQQQQITANIVSEENCIFSGRDIIKHFYPKCNVVINFNDGEYITKNDIIGVITGNALTILSNERVMLNLIQRLCGIATSTNRYVQLVNNKIKILDTRKTTPGIRLFEKYAVTCGGGYNHRLNLSAGYLIKDNHLTANKSIEEIISTIKKLNNHKPIEVEVDTLDQIKRILPLDINGFLLDNMSPQLTKKCVQTIKKYNRKIFIESSGGITLNNIKSYINTGVHAISVGALTHQAQNINIKLEFI